jgi:hypothetical protein
VVAAISPIVYDENTQTVSTNIASSRLLGRTSAGSGVIEQIVIGSGLKFESGFLATNITTSTSDPTGGSDGDIWIKYTA